MRNRPTAAELLQVAEETLYHKVATNLPKEQRYNVAMIISAIGIARRELTNGRFAWDGELDALQKLYGADIQEPANLHYLTSAQNLPPTLELAFLMKVAKTARLRSIF